MSIFLFSEKEKAAARLSISPLFFFALSVWSLPEKKCLMNHLEAEMTQYLPICSPSWKHVYWSQNSIPEEMLQQSSSYTVTARYSRFQFHSHSDIYHLLQPLKVHKLRLQFSFPQKKPQVWPLLPAPYITTDTSLCFGISSASLHCGWVFCRMEDLKTSYFYMFYMQK